jgi:uncharacterized damage-inducible protein DinB
LRATLLLRWWDRVRSGLIETIDKFHDADLDFAPFRGAFSVRELVLHIAQEEFGEVQFGIARQIGEFPPPYPVESYPTVAAAKALLADVHESTTRFMGVVTDSQLAAEIEAGWGGTYLLEDMILHVIEHEIHHRGELSLILGLLGRQGLDA